MSALDFCQDRFRLGGPDERLGRLVVLGEVAIYRRLEVDRGMDLQQAAGIGEVLRKPIPSEAISRCLARHLSRLSRPAPPPQCCRPRANAAFRVSEQ